MKKDNRTNWERGFVDGLMASVQILVYSGKEAEAKDLILESNIPIWELKISLKESGYLLKEVGQILKEINNEHLV